MTKVQNESGVETLSAGRYGSEASSGAFSGVTSFRIVRGLDSGVGARFSEPEVHEEVEERAPRPFLADKDSISSGRAEDRAEPCAPIHYGGNLRMRAIWALLLKLSGTDCPVIIQGETGTGKEVLAREIHASSRRATREFVKLNCAAVPADLMESELFGYERGAFTGAFQRKAGLFEIADGGTLLLDEIGDMDLKLQAKLLQVLQDQEFRRLGGRESVHVNVRVLAATHCDLVRGIKDGTFREDLYYRLNVFTLSLPPLRERRDDVISIAEFLLRRHSSPGTPAVPLTTSLCRAMQTYHWPGNVRELENVVRRLLVLQDTELIANELMSTLFAKAAESSARPVDSNGGCNSHADNQQPVSNALPALERLTQDKQRAEAETVLAALHSARWNRKKAAENLKIDYKALLYKMKKLAIERD
jgi:transcriptional regulator with GAF, ATPase, and Fis domain